MFARFSIEKLRQASYFDHKSYRFNSVDPIINKEEALDNPQFWNLYTYCRNNPITYYDPDGRSEAAAIEAGKTVTPLIPLIATGGPYVAVGAAIVAVVYIGIKATEEGYPIKTARQYEHELMHIAYDAWFGPNKGDSALLREGGSGKKVSPTVKHPTDKRAKDAAQVETAKGKAPVFHPEKEKDGKKIPRHWHGVDSKGNLKPKHHDVLKKKRS